MPKPQSLSEAEIEQLREGLTGGRHPTVWFTTAAVGVEAGRSGKVMALGEPAEGDFLQVRPTGSSDVLAFSPTEVTMINPPRKRAVTAKPAAVAQTSAVVAEKPTATPKPEVSTVTETKPAAQPSEPAAPPRPAAGGRRAKQPAEVVVTLTGTADGEWSVEVVTGKKRAVRGLAVPASAVAQAAKVLHDEVSDAVESVLAAAREQQRVKVEQLQAELAQAQQLLEELID